MTAPVQAAPVAALSNGEIQRIANEGVRSGQLSWLGFDKDALGFYTIPVLSVCHFQFANLIAQAVAAPVAAPVVQGDAVQLVINVAKDAAQILRSSRYIMTADVLETAVAELTSTPVDDRLTALQAKCDQLSASLKQKDVVCDELVAALKEALKEDMANKNESGLSVKTFNQACAAIKAAEVQS